MAYNAGTNLTPLYVGAKYSISRGLGKNCYRNQGYIPFDQSKSGFCDPKFDFSSH